jgi:hypothetical protein
LRPGNLKLSAAQPRQTTKNDGLPHGGTRILLRSNGVSRMAILIEKDRMRLFRNPVANNQDDTKGRKDTPKEPSHFHKFYFPARGMMNVVSSE